MRFILITSLLIINCQWLIAQDSLSIKIGQMILIGFPSAKVDDNVLRVVREGKVGSIIMFEKNIPKTNSYHALKKILWTYQQAAPTRLFIAIDQEGGLVNRLKEKYGFPRSITAWQMGKNASLDSVRFYSQNTASTLAGLGINVNFAPVLDVAIEPTNTVIVKPERSFSSNEDTVAIMAREVIAAHRNVGVITVLKHFPGHGSSLVDTHFGVADVTKTWQERELLPYSKLWSEGNIDAVMTAHIVNRKLDARGLPGTLSDSILTGVLRKKIGFDGLVFSDDLQMQAIEKQYGFEEAIKLSILAGVDILLFCNNVPGSEERKVDNIHAIITKLVSNGVISEQRINESFKRIMNAKNSLVHSKNFYQAENARLTMQIEWAYQRATANLEKAQLQAKKVQENLKQTEKVETQKKKKRAKKKD
jgi:beta-N-acetylhexosaminidase